MKYVEYVNFNYEPSKEDVICEFYVEPDKYSIKEAASTMVHLHFKEKLAGAKACRAAVEAVMSNQILEEKAKNGGELKEALKFF